MAWSKESSASFTGGSGQMAVIGELLHRRCNAAIPLIDTGTDVFAFRDGNEDVARIQVKTALGKPYKSGPGYSAKFAIPVKQLQRMDDPPLYYALAARLEYGWSNFVLISREAMQKLWNDGCGSENEQSGDLELHVQLRPDSTIPPERESGMRAVCGSFDLSIYVNAWESLPPLAPMDQMTLE